MTCLFIFIFNFAWNNKVSFDGHLVYISLWKYNVHNVSLYVSIQSSTILVLYIRQLFTIPTSVLDFYWNHLRIMRTVGGIINVKPLGVGTFSRVCWDTCIYFILFILYSLRFCSHVSWATVKYQWNSTWNIWRCYLIIASLLCCVWTGNAESQWGNFIKWPSVLI